MREVLEKRAGKIAFWTGEARSVVFRGRSLRDTIHDGDDSVGVAEERVLCLKTAVAVCLRESVCLVTAARLCYIDSFAFEVWLSLVERLVRDQEVASSNLVTPTRQNFKPNRDLDFLPVFGSEAFSRGAKRYVPLCSLNKGE